MGVGPAVPEFEPLMGLVVEVFKGVEVTALVAAEAIGATVLSGLAILSQSEGPNPNEMLPIFTPR